MLHLAPIMLEKMGIIVIVAFLLLKVKPFRQIVQNGQGYKEKTILIALFGLFGVISNYTGIEITDNLIKLHTWHMEIDADSAIANTRIMGVVIGGLLAGPTVGLGAGLIAGLHRLTLGGFTAFSCSISTILAGAVGGYLGNRRKKNGKSITPAYAVMVGMSLEAVQMMIILLTAKPLEAAWQLVQLIAIPMIVINGLGMLLFVFIIQTIKRDEERARASQTNLAFHIADQTLPHFRKGLNPQSSKEIASIMIRLTNAAAVSITDHEQVLAHVGEGSDHHIPCFKPATRLTESVLETGMIKIAKSKEEIQCLHKDCPLTAAIVLPLKVKNQIVGTLKMYYTNPNQLDQVQKQLAEGLANLFSTQLELADAEWQAKLLKDAEIKALQAQVHPHFLFNSLNTISALCRTNPDKARELLLELSSFFRGNLQGARQMLIPLEREIESVKAYISIEQTRFPDKYSITFQVEPGLEKIEIPPFTLQPLVENAIYHGISSIKKGGIIHVKIYSENNYMHIIVEDNGKGIPEETLEQLTKQVVHSKKGNGTAVFNISERLKGIYDHKATLNIESKVGAGTTTTITIPLNDKGVFEHHAKSLHR